jgi:hypothetical protein
MFILMNYGFENLGAIAVFSTPEKAQDYVRTEFKHENLEWSDPAENPKGISWVNSGAATFSINPVSFDPQG